MKTVRQLRDARRLLAVLTDGRKRAIGRSALASVSLSLLLLTAIGANAATTTYDVSFSADTFQIGSGPDPAPVDPVTGSFTITLDPAVAVTNSTAISLDSLNIALGSTLCYSYAPGPWGALGNDVLRVGGLNNGSDGITYWPSTNDFWLFISDFTGAPAFEQLGLKQANARVA